MGGYVRRMKRGAFAVVFVLTACGGAAGLGPKPVEEKPAPQPTSINLDRADPAETLSVAEQLLEEPVLVDAMALGSLRCMRVTVKEPTPLPRRVAAESLFDALRAQGLRVDRAGGMWLVSVDNAHPPAACDAEGRQTAASEAPDAGVDAAGETEAGSEAGAVSAYDPEAVLQEVLRSIRALSPTEHAITQRGLELFLDNQPALFGSARIVPEHDRGEAGGDPPLRRAARRAARASRIRERRSHRARDGKVGGHSGAAPSRRMRRCAGRR